MERCTPTRLVWPLELGRGTPTRFLWRLEMDSQSINHDKTLFFSCFLFLGLFPPWGKPYCHHSPLCSSFLLCGPSKQWPGTSVVIGVGGSQVSRRWHLRIVGTGLARRCVNRLGFALYNVCKAQIWTSVLDRWERVWISVLGTGLNLNCVNTLGLPPLSLSLSLSNMRFQGDPHFQVALEEFRHGRLRNETYEWLMQFVLFGPDDPHLTANHFSSVKMIVTTKDLKYPINKQHAIL